MNSNFFLKVGSILGALSVTIGAFGAHLLKPNLLASGHLEIFETAVKYQFYGTFSIIISAILSNFYLKRAIKYSAFFFVIGTIVFSGSLYLICLTNKNIFGAIAPIGGLSLIIGWILLFISIKK